MKSIIVSCFLGALLLAPATARADRLTKEECLRFVPLHHPRAVRQTDASAASHLFGDPASPSYRDVAPLDGIDDARHARLEQLALRFSPLLVMNSYAMPMDFQRFGDGRESWPLSVDTWNVAAVGNRLYREDTINLAALAAAPCDSTGISDDCRLLGLLEEFHPDHPSAAMTQSSAMRPGENLFKLIYFEFPGQDRDSWREIYEDPYSGQIRTEYQDFLRTFVHPFVHEVVAAGPRPAGYELVLQYWLFYPFNDGGNNHIGDWEHINVVVSPRRLVERPLTGEELQAVLAGATDDELVIRRIDYYFHENVYPLDFSSPNVYLDREAWRAQAAALVGERAGTEWFWEQARSRAYCDDAEQVVNTHPIGFIGGDDKGMDQILAPPGGSNRDSHGTFPFPGLYRKIGPAGAAEGISSTFDHRAYHAATPEARAEKFGKLKRGGVVAFTQPQHVKIVPDIERVTTLVMTEPAARRDWSWLILPVRFGYPAVISPAAGLVAHAETGNLAVYGPTHNSGWNQTGPASGFALYQPHKLPQLFPSKWTDEFSNSLGYFNLTLPTLSFIPPFDLAWRALAVPLRLTATSSHPAFHAEETIPDRFVGLGAGYTSHTIADDFLDLVYNREQFRPMVAAIVGYLVDAGVDTNSVLTSETLSSAAATSPIFDVTFFIGGRFASVNSLRHSRSNLDLTQTYSGTTRPLRTDAELSMWEYAGTLRFNLATRAIQPYAKLGYSWVWYRLEDVTVDGQVLSVPNSPWIRKPSISSWENLWPDSWHVGFGFDFLTLRNSAPEIPRGLDLAVKAEWTMYKHSLGLDFDDVPVEDLIGLGVRAHDLPQDRSITRHAFTIGAVVSF